MEKQANSGGCFCPIAFFFLLFVQSRRLGFDLVYVTLFCLVLALLRLFGLGFVKFFFALAWKGVPYLDCNLMNLTFVGLGIDLLFCHFAGG